MRTVSPRALLAMLALALGLAVADGPRAAAAADVVDYEACVVERRPSAALMAMVMDRTLFELDLRAVPATPFALQPDECVVVTGVDRGSGAGLRREFPRADWLIEAVAISSIEDRVNRGSPAGSPD